MRILFLSNSNSLHLVEWADYFAERLGHTVRVLTIPPPVAPYRSCEVVHIGNRLTAHKIFWLALLPRLRRELASFAPDIFVGYRVVSYGFLASLTGFHPLALAAQGGDMVWPPDDKVGQFCVRRAVARADVLNAWSDNIRDEMLRYGADPAKIVVCSRGIDMALFPRLPEKPAAPLIAMTRSLLPSYNTIQLVEAMAHVVPAVPGVRCEIAGDGPERPRLEQRIAELGLGGAVHLVGRLSREAIVGLLERATVYCSTTVTDGLPMSHFEAMAMGCMPVLSDIGANRLWVRDADNGLLAPLGDAQALGRALVRGLADGALRTRAVAANRALVERDFDRERNMKRIEASWEAAITSRRSA